MYVCMYVCSYVMPGNDIFWWYNPLNIYQTQELFRGAIDARLAMLRGAIDAHLAMLRGAIDARLASKLCHIGIHKYS